LQYNRAKELGITLITISHRPSLFKYHHTLLRVLDDEKWETTIIGTAGEVMSLERERLSLEQRIRDLPKQKKRLEVVNARLGTA
jgi:ATP-binding cassette subfamily D (ALD) long-chain fatty acid import protein